MGHRRSFLVHGAGWRALISCGVQAIQANRQHISLRLLEVVVCEGSGFARMKSLVLVCAGLK